MGLGDKQDRVMRTLMLLLIGVLALPAAAQHARAAPWVTGEQLLRKLEPVRPQDVPWTPQSGVSRDELAAMHTRTNVEYVRGYVEALHDATEGRNWCYSDKHQVPSPETFWEESRWGLGRLSAGERRRSASELLSAIWRGKWPCQDEQRRKP
jgi:hypothetical protein